MREWSEIPDNELIDASEFALLEDLAGTDDAFLAELIDIFCMQAQDLLAEIINAVEEGSVQDLVRAAHTLCGSSRNVGATPLGHACAFIEQAATDATFSLRHAEALLVPLASRTVRALDRHRPSGIGRGSP